MGFVNINGTNTHTSDIGLTGSFGISGTYTTTTASSLTTSTSTLNLYTISTPKEEYHILGEDVQVVGYKDPNVSIIIATINVLGKSYYDELLKQGISLPHEVSNFLEKKFLILERDRKIDSIISDGLYDK